MVSTIYAGETDVTLRPGDAIQASKEVADVWEPGAGLEAPTQGIYRDWAGFVSQDNTVTVGVFSGEESIAGPSGMDIIGRLMLLAGGFAPKYYTRRRTFRISSLLWCRFLCLRVDRCMDGDPRR